jgi:orotate phosphoribosyltransferase-like protein
VNELFELLMELIKLGLTPEEISDKLELDFETIIMSSKKCQQ